MNNSRICVDANLIMRLIADPLDELVRQLWGQWDADGRLLVAPTLIYYEVTNALYQYQKQNLISASSAQSALRGALALPIQLHGEMDSHHRALRFAARHALPATYDAHYLALSERLDAEFWTADGRLAAAVGNELSWVHLVEA